VQPFEQEIAQFIVEALNLEDVKPQDIDVEAPLFVTGLGLDSIDALEIGVGLQKKYGVKMSADSADNKKYFASVKALAAFVTEHRGTV
jgi:acyl carrier protein